MSGGKIVNHAELAESFDVSEVTIWEWRKAGMPIQEEGGRFEEHRYNLAVCIRWFAQRAADKASGGETAKDRLARLQADKIERELRQMDQELIPAKQLEPALLAITSSISQALDALPQKLRTHLESSLGVPVDVEIIREEIDDVRSKLPDDIVAKVTSGIAAADTADDGADPATQADAANPMG